MRNNNMKSPQSASSANRNREANYFNSHLELNASFIRYAEVEVESCAVWDGKLMQPFMKFQLKAEINVLIEVFLGVAVLPA